MRRLIVALAVSLLVPTISWACPMCAGAVQQGENQALPAAFYYSILFMLSMPFLLFAGFSTVFYQLHKRARQESQEEHSNG